MTESELLSPNSVTSYNKPPVSKQSCAAQFRDDIDAISKNLASVVNELLKRLAPYSYPVMGKDLPKLDSSMPSHFAQINTTLNDIEASVFLLQQTLSNLEL